MGSYLNLIGSIIIGGLMLLIINNYSASLSQTNHERTLDSITTYNASSIAKLIEFDFNRMGLRVPQTDTVVKCADSSRIVFLSDFNDDGNKELIEYFLSIPDEASGTENPRDRILYRRVNSDPLADATLGVTRFRIRYFNWLGNETTNVTQIKSFEIILWVESTFPFDDRYSAFRWQTKISPPNLTRF